MNEITTTDLTKFEGRGAFMTTRYAWNGNYIDLNEKGNTYFGEEASKIMHLTYKIFRENKINNVKLSDWEYMMTKFIIPALSKKRGVTILKEYIEEPPQFKGNLDQLKNITIRKVKS